MTQDSTPSPAVRFVTITEDNHGQRVDNFLLTKLKGVPKSRIYRLLRKGEVRVNKGRVKPESRLSSGDIVRIPPVRMAEKTLNAGPSAGLRNQLESQILFENDELLVINKPSGLAVHGGSGIQLGLIEALRAMRPDNTLELVHRLDRGTSGCVLVAKKRAALRHLQEQMREKSIDKTYFALVNGRWPKGLTVLDAPLLKQDTAKGEKIVKVNKEGKQAITHFRIKKRFKEMTLLEVDLETGRTHQIRVHCQWSGHPLLGDEKYGIDAINQQYRPSGLKRMFLHAARLGFKMPSSGEKMVIDAPLPKDLSVFLRSPLLS